MKRIKICNILIDNLTLHEVIDRLIQSNTISAASIVVTPNVDHIKILQSDKKFQEIYKNADDNSLADLDQIGSIF